MLVDIAIADAYASCFKFATPKILLQRPNTFSCYYARGSNKYSAGVYTDDTHMSIALVRWVLTYQLDLLQNASSMSFAELMVDTFHRNLRKTYSRRLFDYLNKHINAESLVKDRIITLDCAGAAVRSSVLGVFTPDVVKVLAPIQASLTHDNDIGRSSSILVAYTSSLIRCGHTFEYALFEALGIINKMFPDLDVKWDASPSFPVSCAAINVLQAVIRALRLHWEEPHMMLRTIVDWGGATDSVAAIAIGIRVHAGVIEWPQWATQNMERGPYGYEYLARLDRLLYKTFER